MSKNGGPLPLANRLQKGIWKQRRLKRLMHALILAASGCLLILFIALVKPFYTFNLWFADQFLDSGNPTQNIVIIGIDDASFKTYGKWSEWPRSLHARAVNNLAQAGAAAVGFDVIFTDSSSDDASFADALKKANNVTLAGAGIGQVPDDGEEITFSDFLAPTNALKESCNNIGHVNIIADPDGKVRRVPLIVTQARGNTFPGLSLAVLHTLFLKPLPEFYDLNQGKLNMFSREIPVDASYFLRLNYAVHNGKLPLISYADVIDNKFDPAIVKNRIVLVGMTATGDVDTWPIPNSAIRIPGVLIHAAAIDTVLRAAFLTEASSNITLTTMLILTAICAICLPLFGTSSWKDILKGTLLAAGFLAVYIVTSSIAADQGYILNVLYPSITIMVLYVTNLVFIVLREQADQRFVKNLFGRYVSPQISRQILNLADEGELKLGGEEREVTVLFADIRNFTTLSEQMSPDGVVEMLNRCLPIVIDAITQNNGLVNKFAGDNIMGVWNAPQVVSDHARLAVKAAWEAQLKMVETVAKDPKLSSVQFGIGINTGRALAGNVGSLGRTEYTVIGDVVNLASRICSSAPGGQVLIGPETYREIEKYFEVEPLEPQAFKGKSQLITVYHVKGWRKGANL
jgi:adenylate cyclase